MEGSNCPLLIFVAFQWSHLSIFAFELDQSPFSSIVYSSRDERRNRKERGSDAGDDDDEEEDGEEEGGEQRGSGAARRTALPEGGEEKATVGPAGIESMWPPCPRLPGHGFGTPCWASRSA